jgi:hypothetical protein
VPLEAVLTGGAASGPLGWPFDEHDAAAEHAKIAAASR